MTAPVVLVERTDGIAHVRLNRPEGRNAVNLELCHALREAIERLDGDPEVRVVLISGAGSSFCAGADLTERTGRDAEWVRSRRLASFAAYAALEACRVPVVALLHGAVVGSGGEIALAADFAIAADDVSFRYPEAHWGTIGATQRLQRVVGKRRAKELLYTNRRMEAEEAARLGVVMRVVPAADLLSEGVAIARRICEAPRLALGLTKRAIDLGEGVDLDRGIRIELAAIEQNLAGDEWRDGVSRFTEKGGATAEDDT
jgi:enoyl-CoA hydratase/carnithine racemase